MSHLFRLFIVLVLVVSVSAPLFSGIKMGTLFIGDTRFVVEIADTMDKQIKGLMFRESIPEDFGMLFVYESEGNHGIWMKNTKVHLDIIYLNKNRQVVHIFNNAPPCTKDPCDTYRNEVPAQYILEIKGNRAKELKLKEGDFIFFSLQKP